MFLTEQQLEVDQILLRVSSALSVVGSACIISSFMCIPSFRKDSNRLVFYMAFYDLIGAAATGIGAWGFAKGTSTPLCQFQATFLHIGLLGGVLWSACMAFNLILKFCYNKSLKQLRTYEILYNSLIFCLTWIPASAMYVMNTEGTKMYGSATLWCWISSDYAEWRIYLFYIPIWICIAFNGIVYGFVYFKIRAMSAQYQLDSKILVSYAKHTSLFVIVALLSWVWGSIVRVLGMTDPSNQNAILYNMHAIFTPLQGFCNFVVYVATSPDTARKFKQMLNGTGKSSNS
jgi:hypothetical protein